MTEPTKITFAVQQEAQGAFDWTEGMAIVYVMNGRCEIWHDTNQMTFAEEAIHVINPYELFRVTCSDGGKAIICYFPRKILRQAKAGGSGSRIACSVTAEDSETFSGLRARFAGLFRDSFSSMEHQEQQLQEGAVSLLKHLQSGWLVQDSRQRQENTAVRAKRILNYLETHFDEELSLGELAETEYLSPAYLSRFLRQNLNATFLGLLSDIRLQHALALLEEGILSVTQISYDCGFKNVHAFITQFRSRYGMTPGAWRKRREMPDAMQEQERIQQESAGEFDALLRYAPERPELQSEESLEREHRRIRASLNARGKPLTDAWKRLINIGYAREGLNAEIQRQLMLAQSEIGFEYIRFHGIFDEDMHVYSELPDGTPVFNYAYVDMLFDFLISLNLKPYVEFSYIPPELASRKELIFSRRSYITVANDLDKWKCLIQETVRHWVGRYGLNMVKSWRFTTVGLNCIAFGLASQEDLFEQYEVTWRAVKEISSAFQFGGPGGYSNMTEDGPEADWFLQRAGERGCLPDFFTVKCYPYGNADHDSRFVASFVSRRETPAVVSNDLNYTHNALTAAEGLLNRHRMDRCGIWLEEWNSTIWQRDIANDTCYRAAWLVHSFCQNYSRTQSFGCWLLSDFMEEGVLPEDCFHGGFGLLTYNGIPKPSWNALLFAGSLEPSVIASGEDYLVTRSTGRIVILLASYCHYDHLYRLQYRSTRTVDEAYQAFVRRGIREFAIEITGAGTGTCRMRRYRVGRDGGSSFDERVRMGASGSPGPDEVQYLKEKSRAGYYTEMLEMHQVLRYHAELAPHEIQLLIFDLPDRENGINYSVTLSK